MPTLAFSPHRFWKDCAREIAASYGTDWAGVVARNRRPECDLARQHIMAMLAERGLSSGRIGQLLKRDHTTVLHGVRRHLERAAVGEWRRFAHPPADSNSEIFAG